MRKTNRTRILAATAAVFALTLTGCSGGDPTFDNPGQGAPSNSASPSPKPSLPTETTDVVDVAPSDAPVIDREAVDEETGDVNFCEDQKLSSVKGAAADTFGQRNVLDAYCQSVEMFALFGTTDLMQNETELNLGSFFGIREYMTAEAQDDWDKKVENVVEGDGSEIALVSAFYYYHVENDVVEFDENSDFLTGEKSVSPARTDVVTDANGVETLYLEADYRADLNMIKDGKKVTSPTIKTLAMNLVPSGEEEIPWKISGWNATFKVGKSISR